MHVVEELVEDALRELADEKYQRELWLASDGPEVSSLSECISRLLDDSGLGDALEAPDPVYTAEIDRRLLALQDLLTRMDDSRPPHEILDDPQLAQARGIASGLLQVLRRFAADEADL